MKNEERPPWARRLKQLRESMRYTQKQFSKLLGINQGTLIKYEKGRRDPGINLIVKILEITEAAPGWLILGTKPKEAEECSLYTLYPKLTRDENDTVNEMLTAMNSSRIIFHEVLQYWERIKIERRPKKKMKSPLVDAGLKMNEKEEKKLPGGDPPSTGDLGGGTA